MSRTRRFETRAIVIRAGHITTLLSIPDWYGGQILATVDTWIIESATGIPCHRLPDTQMWVMADLTARTSEDLRLGGWRLCRSPDASHAA
ncbi:hypothetical protein [Streptomyces lavendofoliae]|uniref:Uncharacterized protein n=1 Tax=Streptomyces lavendofoliae TaxID=67314 RepID=A0A918M7W9_9ACTN|nr:hypothetical protein [Streptomyces lavendofoliae]GGU62313.1 hypothetical protein GCM10010274_58860 [Streptomyces lavendofoliae]